MGKTALSVILALLFTLSFVAADSRAEIGLKGIGGEIAIVLPEGDADTTLGLGVVADLGTIIPQLRLEGTAEYWGDSWEAPGYEWSWMTVTIGGTAKYDFPINSSITPFAGGGLGLAISRWSSDWKGTSIWMEQTPGFNTSDTDTDIAFHAVGGVDMPIGANMKFTAQLKYVIDGSDAIWLTGAILVKL